MSLTPSSLRLRLLSFFDSKLDTTASLEDALTARMRRGVRVSSFIGIGAIIVFFALDFVFPAESGVAYSTSRAMLGLLCVIAGVIAGRAHAYKHVSFAAGLLSVGVVTHALISIAESGGAKSTLLPLFPLSVMIMTYMVPMTFRRTLLFYPLSFVAYALTIWLTSVNGTTREYSQAFRWGTITTVFSMAGAWLNYRTIRDTYQWRAALREESRRAALALERTRIARDLHDHIGARLTGIALRAERQQRKADEASRDALMWIQDTVRLCLEELRDTIWALSSTGRDSRELVATLRRRAEDIADAADMRLDWEMDAAAWHGRLSSGVSVALSAIVREALTNTLRHSGARSVRIALSRDEHEIRLEIADDGRGLGQTPSEGRGLGNMRTRAKEQNGDVQLEPNGEQGVKVVARIPIAADATARVGEME